MGEATGFTAERMLEIEDSTVVDGSVVGDDLILEQRDGTLINAGSVRGPAGDASPPAGPAGGELAGNYPNPTLADFAADKVLTWGGDTNLYRLAASNLKTDDAFSAALGITSLAGSASLTTMAFGGPTTEPGLKFGSALDTNLYRSAADTLKTDDTLVSGVDIYARSGASEVGIGNMGPTAQPGIKIASDTNIYRFVANVLKTDDQFHAALGLVASSGGATQSSYGGSGPAGEAGFTLGSAGDTNLYRSAANTLKTDDTFVVGVAGGNKNELSISSTTANTGITIGGDVNLYRSAVDVLKTDDAFWSTQQVAALIGAATQTVIGNTGPASEAGIKFGSAGDTNLYRSAADTLKTDDVFHAGAGVISYPGGAATQVKLTDAAGGVGVGGITFGSADDIALYRYSASMLKSSKAIATATEFYAREGTAFQVVIGAQGPASEAGLKFGVSGDTNLYRSAADILATDDTFYAGQNIRARNGAATEVLMGNVGPVSEAGIKFGSAGDTNLYRSAADTLRTDDRFLASLNIGANAGSSTLITMGNVGPASESGITFGSAGDTNLYRAAANTLKTDDALHATQPDAATIGLRALGFANNTQPVFQIAAGASANAAMLSILNSSAVEVFSISSGGAIAILDTNLYRASTAVLKTDSGFQAVGNIIAKLGTSQVNSGNVGPALEAGLRFGSAADTNLYRSAADTLRTDDAFHADTLKSNGGAITSRMSFIMQDLTGNSFVQYPEQSADPAAAADVGKVFARDNGAGKTQLCVRFGTGAVQVLATEP